MEDGSQRGKRVSRDEDVVEGVVGGGIERAEAKRVEGQSMLSKRSVPPVGWSGGTGWG